MNISDKEEQSKVAQRYLRLCSVDLDNALENMSYLHPDDLEELSIGVKKIQNELQMLLIASKHCNK
tara:strand:+ start:319 stop:516 length:198 start_codon:yes stop_codon:yes gene_type:complete